MSNCAIDWALSVKLGDPATKIVLFVLANRADDLGQCWPTHQSISKEADQSPRSIRRRLDELEQAELIERKRRRRASTIYTLKMPGLRTANSVPSKGSRTATAGHSRNLRTAKLELRTATAGRQNPQYEPSIRKTLRHRVDDGFSKFWESYPRKVAKKAAEKAFARAVKETTLEQMLAALAFDKQDWKEERFTPHPATWLNGGRYLDHQDKLKPVKTYRPPGHEND